MGGKGPAPKEHRQRTRDEKRRERGNWSASDGIGWQHGEIPSPPSDMLPAAVEAWQTWMRSWPAAHWTPGDLPALRVAIRLYDQVERGKFPRAAELRMWLDTLGISPKGQQDRRWRAPEHPPKPTAVERSARLRRPSAGVTSIYDHLRRDTEQ
jgi:hypothetical protein